MNYLLLLAIGLIPSLVWLFFYLKKDRKPEPKKMIILVFFCGIVIALPVFLIALMLQRGLDMFFSPEITFFLSIIIIAPFVEETSKYLAVKYTAFKKPDYDEPVDSMVYMIVAALGFAAIENILLLFSLFQAYDPVGCPIGHPYNEIILVSIFRFMGAIFLHALASATVGYFIALAFYKKRNRNKMALLGLGIAVVLHAIYNFSIIKTQENIWFLSIAVILLLSLAIFISKEFERLQPKKRIKT